MTHRAYLAALVSEGSYTVHGGNRGEDCEATLRAVQQLGVEAKRTGEAVRLTGLAGSLTAPQADLDVGNSGTAMRLLLGVLAGQPFTSTLSGDESLNRRPMARVTDPLALMGCSTKTTEGHAPVQVQGAKLQGIDYELPVASAQIKSALLFAGLQAEGTTRIRGGNRSRDHTERLFRAWGAKLEGEPDDLRIVGPGCLRAQDFHVPADPSAAAFYGVAAAIVPGSEIQLHGVSQNPTRIRGLELLSEMGLHMSWASSPTESWEPQADVLFQNGSLTPIVARGQAVVEAIDELPALAVAAAFAEGTSEFRDASELKVKESNRLLAVAENLRAIGGDVELLDDGWRIRGSGGEPLEGGIIQSHDDHRIAMALLVAGLRTKRGVEVRGEPMIETSDPYFMSNLRTMMESAS